MKYLRRTFLPFILGGLLVLTEPFIINTRVPQKVQYTAVATDTARQHAATHRIGVYNIFEGEVGHCSGTAVGPHAILTAQHCFHDSNQIRLDADLEPTTILAAFVDGNDHVICLVNHDFDVWMSIEQRKLVAGEKVHFWGNPGESNDVARAGFFVRLGFVDEVSERIKLQIFILPCFPGDSGSGIVDENGNIVGVLSMGDASAHEWSVPLAFLPAQIAIATR